MDVDAHDMKVLILMRDTEQERASERGDAMVPNKNAEPKRYREPVNLS